MDIPRHHYVSRASYVDLHSKKMTSPTCKDLGIPRDTGIEEVGILYPIVTRRIIHNPALHLDGLRYAARTSMSSDPSRSLCILPLSGALALHTSGEPSFIRKRNERERDRVRYVNEGYARLNRHLPNGARAKRHSKVDTLRGAITYIRHLEQLLTDSSLPPTPHHHHLHPHPHPHPHPHLTEARFEPATPDCKENVCPHTTTAAATEEEREEAEQCAPVCCEGSSSAVEDTSMSYYRTASDSEDEISHCVNRQRVC